MQSLEQQHTFIVDAYCHLEYKFTRTINLYLAAVLCLYILYGLDIGCFVSIVYVFPNVLTVLKF